MQHKVERVEYSSNSILVDMIVGSDEDGRMTMNGKRESDNLIYFISEREGEVCS